jgi:hypothetical protein
MNKQEVLNTLDIEAFYTSELPSIKWNGSGKGQALCPFHKDTKPSLSINLKTGNFNCFGCGKKDSVFGFYMTKYGVNFKSAKEALARYAGLTSETQQKNIETYDYVDESGNLIFQTVRFEPKDFRQRRPDGNGGWIYNLQGIKPIPYNLPEIIKDKRIIIVEGEKDADNLKQIGLTATSNPMGAGKWRTEYNQYFQGKIIVIIPDNDELGRKHAVDVAKNLKDTTESVKIVELPDLPEHGDVSDWINQGVTKERLLELIDSTPEWTEPKAKDLVSQLPTLSDIASLDLSIEWVLDGLIPKGGITVLYSKGGRGKTTLMLQIGNSISEGIPFEGLSTIKLPVIYIDFDNPLNVIVDKAKRLGGNDNFHYWHISNALTPAKIDTDKWETYKRLPQNALLIFDTLKSCQGLDMNKDETMAFILERFRVLRDMGCTVVLLHHTPKSSDTIPKNNTTITDNADHVLGLVPLTEDGENSKNGTLVFGCRDNDKSRYPKNYICLSFDGEIFEYVPDPEDAKFEDMKGLIAELTEEGGKPNQSKIITAASNKWGFSRPKTINLLNRGEEKHWKCTRIRKCKNQKVYEPMPVVKLSDSICSVTTEQQPEKANQLSKQHTPINTPQTIENTELSSCQEDTLTTDTTDDKCNGCIMTGRQKELCEVQKPCPKEER